MKIISQIRRKTTTTKIHGASGATEGTTLNPIPSSLVLFFAWIFHKLWHSRNPERIFPHGQNPVFTTALLDLCQMRTPSRTGQVEFLVYLEQCFSHPVSYLMQTIPVSLKKLGLSSQGLAGEDVECSHSTVTLLFYSWRNQFRVGHFSIIAKL